MTSLQRGARAALIFGASILLLAFLLAGMAAAFPEEPLAPLICPFLAAPSSFWGAVTLNGIEAQPGLKLAAWINHDDADRKKTDLRMWIIMNIGTYRL